MDGALDTVTDVFNRHLVPRLLAVNAGAFAGITDHPRIVHSRISTVPPAIAQWLKQISEFMDTAEPEDVEWIRSVMGMPYRSARDIAARQQAATNEESRRAAPTLPPAGEENAYPPVVAEALLAAARRVLVGTADSLECEL